MLTSRGNGETSLTPGSGTPRWVLQARRPDGAPHMQWLGSPIDSAPSSRAFCSPPGTIVQHCSRGISYDLGHWCVSVFPHRGRFNVMADFDRDGRWMRAYVNLATTPRIDGPSITWTDLYVDVLFTSSDAAGAIVDQHELLEACKAQHLDLGRAEQVLAHAEGIARSTSPLFQPLTLPSYLEMLTIEGSHDL